MQHSGVRRSRHQHLVCKSCGNSLFVLPKDVYPQPHPNWMAKAASRDEDVDRGSVAVEPELPGSNDSGEFDLETPVEEVNEAALLTDEESPPGRTPRSRSKSPESDRRGVGDEVAEAVDPIPVAIPQRKSDRRKDSRKGISRRSELRKKRRVQDEDLADEPKKPGLLASAASALGSLVSRIAEATGVAIRTGVTGFIRFWTPLRLVFAAIFLLVMGAIAFSIRQGQREVASRVIREQMEGVQQSLEKQDWLTASQRLEPVVDALDRLGRYDSEANLLRQQYRETSAITHLSGVSLFDLIQSADEVEKRSGPSGWEEKFETAYQGDWLIIEGKVRQIAERRDGRITKGYQLDFPWQSVMSGRTVIVRADLPEFPRLGVGNDPELVIFAAPLKSCSLDQKSNSWRVEFDGERGFLWVNPETYASLGFTYDELRSEEMIKEIFDRQSPVMEQVR